MKRALMFALAALVAGGPSVAIACTPPPGGLEEIQARDIAAFVGVYEARIENVSPGPYEYAWDFAVHPTRKVWGEPQPQEQALTFEPGACTNWFFMMDEDHGDKPPEGLDVVVFATPAAIGDGRWLYIARANSPSAAYLFERWLATSTQRQPEAVQ